MFRMLKGMTLNGHLINNIQRHINLISMASNPVEIKNQILKLTREYSRLMHKANKPGVDNELSFIPSETTVPYAGRVFNEDEVEAAVSSTLDFWLTLGPEGEAFEKKFASFLGVKHTLLVNSGPLRT